MVAVGSSIFNSLEKFEKCKKVCGTYVEIYIESKVLLLLLPLTPSAMAEGVFLPFFALIFNTMTKSNREGGEVMDEDNDIFEMFLEMMEQLDFEDPNGRMRMLSKDPRYAADDPAAQPIRQKHIER